MILNALVERPKDDCYSGTGTTVFSVILWFAGLVLLARIE
jgi:hypothetical protein